MQLQIADVGKATEEVLPSPGARAQIRVRAAGRGLRGIVAIGGPTRGRLQAGPEGALRSGGLDVGSAGTILVVGSRAEAREGRGMVSARSQNAIEEATAPVLVVARGVALHFETLVTA